MRKGALVLLVAIAAVAPARANDSTAELTTGGLLFVHNPNVEMRSEDLHVSAKEIRVRYSFFNKSIQDVTVLVAFPLPDIKVDGPDDNISVPTDDPVNVLAFTTTVNGKPTETKVEQRVLALGIDRTQLLRSLGIPLAPHLPATNQALDRLPPDKWEEFLRVGLAEIEEYDTGSGTQKHLAARWTLQTAYYWEQTFPAMAETLIEHQYKPSVGASVQTSLGAPNVSSEAWYQEYKEKYCFTPDFLAEIERARTASGSKFGAPYGEERLDYVLKTGANWSGPIKDFRMVVDKGDADSLVSFCGQDVKTISDTQVEMRKVDYVPDGNLAVLILKKLPPQ
jgi:Domain of unknown function (DUF4424)